MNISELWHWLCYYCRMYKESEFSQCVMTCFMNGSKLTLTWLVCILMTCFPISSKSSILITTPWITIGCQVNNTTKVRQRQWMTECTSLPRFVLFLCFLHKISHVVKDEINSDWQITERRLSMTWKQQEVWGDGYHL